MLDTDKQDRDDVAGTLAGDREAFSGIITRHGEAVQKQMRNFTRDPVRLEELVQDVFVEAYTCLAKFRGDSPFSHWLYRIATFTGRQFWKKRERDKNSVPLHDNTEEAGGETAGRDAKGAAELLFDLLRTLPPDDRTVMTLMYLENLDQAEIARRMGWTRVMVAVRLHRAKQRLKKLGGQDPWKGRVEWMLS